MKFRFLWGLTITAFCVALLLGGYAKDSSVADLVSRADAILVGSITDDVTDARGIVLTILVDRVLKGNASLGSRITVRYDFPPNYRGVRSAAKRRGLFFLASTGTGDWKLLPASAGYPTFESLYYPVPTPASPSTYPYTANTATIDKVISEFAEAAEMSDGAEGFSGLAMVGYKDSSLVAKIMIRFSQSTSANLRAWGLGRMIARGDSSALFQALKELDVLAKSPWGSNFVSCFSAFRGTDPAAIRELGRITDGSTSSSDLRRFATLSLRAVHTKEALPFLVRLLDSPDWDIRGNALHGINSFVVGLPVESPGVNMDAAIDAVLNPGHHKPISSWAAAQILGLDATEEASRYIRFGLFSDPAEEARYIEFWKGWWQRYSIRLPQ